MLRVYPGGSVRNEKCSSKYGTKPNVGGVAIHKDSYGRFAMRAWKYCVAEALYCFYSFLHGHRFS